MVPLEEDSVTRSTWTWLFQRVTGISLVVFLFTHMNFNHLLLGDRLIDFSLVNARLAGSLWWKIFYLLFVPSCVYHAMNGLWGILADYRPSVAFRRIAIICLWLFGLALIYVGADTLINLFEV